MQFSALTQTKTHDHNQESRWRWRICARHRTGLSRLKSWPRSAACALELDSFSRSFRETWREKGVLLGVTRIGINAGQAIVGNFGRGRFFEYTAYGDTINIAARLEAANKELGNAHSRERQRDAPDAGFPRPTHRRTRAPRQE